MQIEQKKEEELQELETSDDKKIVVENELSSHVEQQEKPEILEYNLAQGRQEVSTASEDKEKEKSEKLPYKVSVVPDYKGDVELDTLLYKSWMAESEM